MNYFLKIILFSVFALSACKKKKTPAPVAAPVIEAVETLEIRVQPYFNGQTMNLDSLYTDANGKIYKFTDFLFYFNQIKNGSVVLADAAVFDYREKGTLMLTTTGKSSDFSNLTFNIGIDSLTNHLDPNTYPNSSPLSSYGYAQMCWGWNPGYIFINLEGRADTLVNATVTTDQNLSYHIGKDVNLRNKTLTNLIWSGPSTTKTLNLKIDVAQLFSASGSTINVNSEPFTHSAPSVAALTNKFRENFYNNIVQ